MKKVDIAVSEVGTCDNVIPVHLVVPLMHAP